MADMLDNPAFEEDPERGGSDGGPFAEGDHFDGTEVQGRPSSGALGGASPPALEMANPGGGEMHPPPSFLTTRVAHTHDEAFENDRDLEPALHHHRSKATSSWLVFLGLAYKSVGIVYGDLGTSPMYLWQTCFSFPATEKDIVGALSLVLWTLSLMIFKYVAIVLPANDLGEGGTFAIYSLLCRHTKITIFGLKHDSDKQLSAFHHHDLSRKKRGKGYLGRKIAKALEKSEGLQQILLVMVLIGTCALVGDGVLTPAVTVLSAMTGLQVPDELLNADGTTKLSNGVVIGATCVIMAGIFMAQRFGTGKIGVVFAPILVSFFLLNAGIGLYNINKWNPGIFKAFSPHYGIMYLVRNGKRGWVSLGGICLCITGVEGLFADLGHFNVSSIRTSTLGVVYPSLLIIYLGQGAYLSVHPEDVTQAYFKGIPHAVYWPTFVISTLAAMVASQAIISGTFSILAQSMSLSCFPRLRIIHTSKVVKGQIYLPEVNYTLMVLSIACVLGFSLPQPSDKPINGDSLSNAFGIAVMTVMLITTGLVTLIMLVVWRSHLALIAVFFGFFVAMETVYLTANLFKIVHGGWVPIIIAFVVLLISYCWHWGSTKRYTIGCAMGNQLEDVLVPEEDLYPSDLPLEEDPQSPVHHNPLQLCLKSTGQRVVVTKGAALFYCDTIYRLPPHFAFTLKMMPAVHEIMVFISLREIPVPHISSAERLVVKPLAYTGFYRVVARYGYMDEPNHDMAFAREVLQAISHYLQYGSRKDLLPRVPTESSLPSVPGSPLTRSSAGLTHVGSSSALVPERVTVDSPKSDVEYLPQGPDKIVRRARLDARERGLQQKKLKEAEGMEIMYMKTKPILKAAPGSGYYHRLLLGIYNYLVNVSISPTDTLNIPRAQLLMLCMVYDI